jgi:uncharacterized membrane protein
MEMFATVLYPLVVMIPFVVFYSVGVSVRVARQNKGRPAVERARYDVSLLGEAMPGMFEMIVTLAAVFGLALESKSETASFQLLGMLASAAYIAFRSGYTYSESLLTLKHAPPPIARAET